MTSSSSITAMTFMVDGLSGVDDLACRRLTDDAI
jgi:hypothetical protein